MPYTHDRDERFRVIDSFKHRDHTQVISLGLPPLEKLGTPHLVKDLARIANDAQSALVRHHPDCFMGLLTSLPMNVPDEAV